MHDAAADYCKQGGRGRARAVQGGRRKDGEVSGLADFQRTDFRVPPKRTRAFESKRLECGVAVTSGGLGLSPQIQIADADHGVGAKTYGYTGLSE